MCNQLRPLASRPTATASLVTVALCFALFVGGCSSGSGGDDETPTIPTVDAAADETQLAVDTEEAATLATATRAPGPAEQPTLATGTVRLITTTDLVEPGLMQLLTTMFEAETGYSVEIVALPAEGAIAEASAGNADAILVNAPDEELEFVATGGGIERAPVLHGDYIIVGPDADPAAVREQERANDAFRAIAAAGADFTSRGDDSAAHALEMRIWGAAGVDPVEQTWYDAIGRGGMITTLVTASQRGGYTLSDRVTFLKQHANVDLEILLAGDPAQVDPYHVVVVNAEVHPAVNAAGARAFAAFLTRADIQQIIGEYGTAEFGERIFVPTAGG